MFSLLILIISILLYKIRINYRDETFKIEDMRDLSKKLNIIIQLGKLRLLLLSS